MSPLSPLPPDLWSIYYTCSAWVSLLLASLPTLRFVLSHGCGILWTVWPSVCLYMQFLLQISSYPLTFWQTPTHPSNLSPNASSVLLSPACHPHNPPFSWFHVETHLMFIWISGWRLRRDGPKVCWVRKKGRMGESALGPGHGCQAWWGAGSEEHSLGLCVTGLWYDGGACLCDDTDLCDLVLRGQQMWAPGSGRWAALLWDLLFSGQSSWDGINCSSRAHSPHETQAQLWSWLKQGPTSKSKTRWTALVTGGLYLSFSGDEGVEDRGTRWEMYGSGGAKSPPECHSICPLGSEKSL